MSRLRRIRRSLGRAARRITGFLHPSMRLDGLEEGSHLEQFASVPPREAAIRSTQVLFLRTDGIGDGLMSAGLLRPLATAFPHWQIRVICPAPLAGIFEKHPSVRGVIPFDLKGYRQNRKIFQSLNHQVESLNCDLLLSTVRSRYPHTDRLAMAAGARFCMAISDGTAHFPPQDREASDRFFTHVYRPPAGKTASEWEIYQGFLSWMGVESPYAGPCMTCTPEDLVWAADFLEEHNLDPSGLILLMAGAVHEIRHYGGYGEAIQRARVGMTAVVALGAAQDAAISQWNLQPLRCPTFNLCGKTTLGQAAALMTHARVALGAETGLAHLACAMGLPQVVLLGGGHFGRFMPYSPLTAFVSLPLDCFGCGWICQHREIHCVKAVPAGLVATALEQAWDRGRDPSSPLGILAGPRTTAEACQDAAWADARWRVDRPCLWIESP